MYNISIYPNPASSALMLEWAGSSGSSSGSSNKQYAVKIYNAIGQQVLYSEFYIPNSALDISSLPSGLYYVSLQTPEGMAVKKFEVMR